MKCRYSSVLVLYMAVTEAEIRRYGRRYGYDDSVGTIPRPPSGLSSILRNIKDKISKSRSRIGHYRTKQNSTRISTSIWGMMAPRAHSISAVNKEEPRQRLGVSGTNLFQVPSQVTTDTPNPQQNSGNEVDAAAVRFAARVVGGQNVGRNNRVPWQAGIRVYRWRRGFVAHCGATILTDSWVLSAAHCFHGM